MAVKINLLYPEQNLNLILPRVEKPFIGSTSKKFILPAVE